MTIFEVAEGQVTETEDNSNGEALQKEVVELESIACAISRSLGGLKLDRAVVSFETRGFGIRYSTFGDENFCGRGIETKGRMSPSEIVPKLD